MNSKSWKDDVMNGVEYTKALLNYMLKERSQLYGMIIYLMKEMEVNKVILPPPSEMIAYESECYILIDKEDGEFFLKLLPREDEESEDGDSTS